MIVLSHFGTETLLKNVLGISSSYLWYMKLFINNVDITPDTEAKHLIQPDFRGYDKIMLWNWRVYKEGLLTKAKAHEAVWTLLFDLECELPVFGYYVTDYNDQLLYAEKFTSGPFKILNAGSSINVTPALKM